MRLFVLPLLLIPAVASAADWEQVYEADGVVVWRRPVEGSSFVEFRGRGVVEASMKQVLAVLHDQQRKTEWMHRCAENRLVAAKGLGKMVIYNRTGSNVPLVADRDVVVETKLTYSLEDRHVRIDAHTVDHPKAPPIDGVVRMPKLDLSWDLVALDRDRTQVTYQVAADPGGMLPAWVVNMVSKKIPYHTITNLRSQVKKDYERSLAVVDMSFDWAKVGL